MRPAAELDAPGARLEHPHTLAVLVAEERNRPEFPGLVHRGLEVAHGIVAQYFRVRQVLDALQLLVRHRGEMGEVETQPLGIHRGSLLLDVVAEHLTQRPVQHMRRSVVATDRGAPVHLDGRGRHLADLDGPLDGLGRVSVQHSRHGVGGVQHADGARRRGDGAGVADLSAGLRVERRPVEEHRVADDGDDGRCRRVLVPAGEHRRPMIRQHRTFGLDLVTGGHTGLAASGAGTVPLLPHGDLEGPEVDLDAAQFGHLLGHLEREAVGVVQLERNAAVERTAGGDPRQFGVQQDRPPGEGLAELVLLATDHLDQQALLLHHLGVGVAHDLDAALDEWRHDHLLDAEHVRETHRPTDDAAQHVAAILVRRDHSVRHQERGGACVVRQQPQRDVGEFTLTESVPGDTLCLVDESRQDVRRVQRRTSLQDTQDPLQTCPGVHIPCRQVGERSRLAAEVLGEHQVPDLDETVLGQLVRRSALGAVLRTEVEEDLRGRAARAGLAHLPEVVLVEALDALARHTDTVGPDVLRLVVGDVARDPDPVPVDPEGLGDELPRPRDGFGLEVVTEAEVAQHLEERQMPRGPADGIEVVVFATGTDALLDRDGPGRRIWRRFLTEEVRDEWHHARVREHRGRRVRRDQTAGPHRCVSAFHEEVHPSSAEFVGGQRTQKGGGHGELILPVGRTPSSPLR